MDFLFCEIILKIPCDFFKLMLVTDSLDRVHRRLIKYFELIDIVGYHVHFSLLVADSLQKIIEDVVISLSLADWYDSALLQKIADDECTLDVHLCFSVKEKNKFAKTWGVIIPDSLCVSEGLQNLVAA